MNAQIGWVIVGAYGIYFGWCTTRKAMIEDHCTALGKPWSYCRRKGDRCIKVKITPIRRKVKKARTR